MNKIQILKVLVGSWAHGLNDENSDKDYRSVYIIPTTEILSLGYRYKGTHWTEGEAEDNTSYELGHFLFLATKSNPTTLEIFRAPIIESTPIGDKLRELFPHVWSKKMALDAFIGYGLNQRKKFLDKKDNRQNKYAVAYIRTLNNLIDLLRNGTFSLEIPEGKQRNLLLRFRKGNYTIGEVIDEAERLTALAKRTYEDTPDKKTDYEKVNDFLIETRHKYFYGENKWNALIVKNQ